MKPRNQAVDIAKLIASLFVVGIHTNLLSDVNPQLNLIITGLICRMGVPFFALCSGFFLVEQESLLPQWQKLMKLYIVWTIIYLIWLQINWIETDYISTSAYLGYFKSAILSGSYYHLWYVLYAIYAIPVFWLIRSFLKQKAWIIIAIVLNCIYALYYGYEHIVPPNIYALLSLCEKGYAFGAAQFVLLPYLLVGAWLKKNRYPLSQKKIIFIALISFSLLTVEAEYLKTIAPNHEVSRIFMILPTATALFCIVRNTFIVKFPTTNFARLSLLIYCIHPIFCYYLNPISPNTLIAWCGVTFLSFGSAFFLCKFKYLYNYRQ